VKAITLSAHSSIGTQTLDIVAQYPDQFRIVGLAAGRNVEEMLRAQIQQFRPAIAAIGEEEKLPELKGASDLDPQPILVAGKQV